MKSHVQSNQVLW